MFQQLRPHATTYETADSNHSNGFSRCGGDPVMHQLSLPISRGRYGHLEWRRRAGRQLDNAGKLEWRRTHHELAPDFFRGDPDGHHK